MEPDPFLQALPARTELPEAIELLHGGSGRYSGRCTVETGRGLFTGLALRLGQMPPDGEDVAVQVKVDRNGPVWVWTRDFGGHITRSRLTYDHDFGCVRERFGRLSIWLMPVFENGRLSIRIRRLSFLGIPCPKFLLPRSKTVEWEDDEGRFRFDVSADMPFLGTLIRYHGWLTSDHAQAAKC
ncbi:DUF4166 domain-containing protein [Ruegeria sp. Ofav3-42]|uniref:DUF4166 domain-containing protein n=1 Tax=Ruegeria sp. Ofav3-42 TaxID=2917759 RepID=UPI001EF42D9E|nr:DUF4166 domain-containing protein [Ruegeria sp. Ofav3-42]MCG7519752.1 DUF4166 domain-containing protein [Ruegeria sp. Ofav3-42]